jgi:hypothetical protein
MMILRQNDEYTKIESLDKRQVEVDKLHKNQLNNLK